MQMQLAFPHKTAVIPAGVQSRASWTFNPGMNGIRNRSLVISFLSALKGSWQL